ncbi:MAG: hypothetical protein AVDCRST_MAG88-1349, partial [uncultured Thermomicrobiales bacterium]
GDDAGGAGASQRRGGVARPVRQRAAGAAGRGANLRRATRTAGNRRPGPGDARGRGHFPRPLPVPPGRPAL